jgi:PKD repeat protein
MSLIVTNTGGGLLAWSASGDVPWLSLEPSGGSLASGRSHAVSVHLASSSLDPGAHEGHVIVSAPDAFPPSGSAAVRLQVLPQELQLLTVTGGGSGKGRVVSSPAGIDCLVVRGGSAGDCHELFEPGTAISLTATAAPGSSFDAWEEACTGAGSCQVTLDRARQVRARFQVDPPENAPPVAAFGWEATYLEVTFTDGSTDVDGTVVEWSWDFGDGNGSAVASPVHRYAVAGTYGVTLTVTDDEGATDAVTETVVVEANPGLVVSPSTLMFVAQKGADPIPNRKIFTVTNVSDARIRWRASEDSTWLSVQSPTGALDPGESEQVSVTVVGLGSLPAGTLRAYVTVVDRDREGVRVTVTVLVSVLGGGDFASAHIPGYEAGPPSPSYPARTASSGGSRDPSDHEPTPALRPETRRRR